MIAEFLSALEVDDADAAAGRREQQPRLAGVSRLPFRITVAAGTDHRTSSR
jgi:hypothetical protein